MTPATAFASTDFIHARAVDRHGFSSTHFNAYDKLKHGSTKERVAAATTLRTAVADYPLNPVLEIWYAGKDTISKTNQKELRTAGWKLLTECVKHQASSDLERKEYFQTLSAPANPDDFRLQLESLIELTKGGRTVSGFDYELMPLLTTLLRTSYEAARAVRRNTDSNDPNASKNSIPDDELEESQNLKQLFVFIHDVVKFSFNSIDGAALDALIDNIVYICSSTLDESDLQSCITILDAIVTFGSIPNDKLKDCVITLGSIFCVVTTLQKQSWHTLSNLCKSHNGQATVRILLDALRDPSTHSLDESTRNREIRGALAVLQKLLSKTAEKGYPPVPFALLVDGMASTLQMTKSISVCSSILKLLNSIFDDGDGNLHRILIDEDWSIALEVSTESFKRLMQAVAARAAENKTQDSSWNEVRQGLLTLVNRLSTLVSQKSKDFVPRQRVMKFFTDVHELLPDSTVLAVLDYFQEFRCCSPSDLEWEENITLVLDAFFLDRSRPSKTRLRALATVMDAYHIVDLVGDGAEQNFIPRFTRHVLQDVNQEHDANILGAIVAFAESVVESCDMELFGDIMQALNSVIHAERPSRAASPKLSSSASSTSDSTIHADPTSKTEPSLANIVTGGLVAMFLRLMSSHCGKSTALFNALVSVVRSTACEVDARLSAMQLLFRIRADWANRIFITNNLDVEFLAIALRRTEASLAKRRNQEAAQALRMSRNDHGTQSRSSRGMSIGQSSAPTPMRTMSGASNPISSYQQQWMYSATGTLPDHTPNVISSVLVSCEDDDVEDKDSTTSTHTRVLDIPGWMEAVMSILKGAPWEVYSFAIVHLPAQLSNHSIFRGAIRNIKELRRIVCDQIRNNNFKEPPNVFGLRRADVAIALYQSLTMLLSYHHHFAKSDEDDIVSTFVVGLISWERCARPCIHALSICCHELPLSTSKSLSQILTAMQTIITQSHVSIHILEFLASLSRLHHVYVNFREDDYRTVFAICFRYLDYARDKRHSNRSSRASEPSTPLSNVPESTGADDLPQYVYAIAYHVIIFWFLALKLPDRATHVSWITKKLFADAEASGQPPDEQAVTTLDFMQRVTFADVDESTEDPYFTSERFGEVQKKRWVIGNSIVTIRQGVYTGWAQITKRQPSGTSAYAVRETYRPPPPHQVENHVDITREGQAATNAILPSHLLIQILSPIPQSFDSARPIPLPDDDAVDRAVRVFDLNSTVDGHKVGVIYIGEGQTKEADILANVSGCADYTTFLNNLGTLTKLKGATFNTQGLDREYGSDGQYTFCWRDRVTEIVFHVITQMPTNLERDPQCTLKKRHIGNDFVNIVFNDSGLPFNFDTFPSQFNLVYIVISPASRASFTAAREAEAASEADGTSTTPFYMVQVVGKPGFPAISPASETKIISLKALPEFIRLVSLNAALFSTVWSSREGGEHISSWSNRLKAIVALRNKYDPRLTGSSPSPTPGSNGGMTGHAADSRPTSTVRESISSFRRTSVANFFTGSSSNNEPPSHRSSTVSTPTTTHDTEPFANATSPALVESVDFSKWA